MKLKKKLVATFLLATLITGMMVPAVKANAEDNQIPQYRLLNPNTGEHFYSTDANERNSLIQKGWQYEGVNCLIPQKDGTPIYRLCNLSNGDHHYTSDANEKTVLSKTGWRDEGIGWYSKGDIPVYRLFNPNAKGIGAHHYTTDSNEKNTLVKNGWNDEGIGWYGKSAANFVDSKPVSTPPANNQKPTSVPVPSTTAALYQQYIADGSFTDFVQFGLDAGANDVGGGAVRDTIFFVYGKWFITVTTSILNPNKSLIGVGSSADYCDDRVFIKRVYVANNSGNMIPCWADGVSVDRAVLDLLPNVIDYCKSNSYSDSASPVSGYNWIDYSTVYDEFQ